MSFFLDGVLALSRFYHIVTFYHITLYLALHEIKIHTSKDNLLLQMSGFVEFCQSVSSFIRPLVLKPKSFSDSL